MNLSNGFGHLLIKNGNGTRVTTRIIKKVGPLRENGLLCRVLLSFCPLAGR